MASGDGNAGIRNDLSGLWSKARLVLTSMFVKHGPPGPSADGGVRSSVCSPSLRPPGRGRGGGDGGGTRGGTRLEVLPERAQPAAAV